VLGLSYGPVYPTNAAIVIAGTPHMAGTAMSRVGVFASIGGMALPWLQGALLANVGTAAAAAQTLAMAFGMAVMWVMLQKLTGQKREIFQP
jgi:fucose permease